MVTFNGSFTLSKNAEKLSIDTGSLFAILDAYSLNFISIGLPPFIRLRVRRFGIYILMNIFLYLLEGRRETWADGGGLCAKGFTSLI